MGWLRFFLILFFSAPAVKRWPWGLLLLRLLVRMLIAHEEWMHEVIEQPSEETPLILLGHLVLIYSWLTLRSLLSLLREEVLAGLLGWLVAKAEANAERTHTEEHAG